MPRNVRAATRTACAAIAATAARSERSSRPPGRGSSTPRLPVPGSSCAREPSACFSRAAGLAAWKPEPPRATASPSALPCRRRRMRRDRDARTLLRRSGLTAPGLGRNLHLHPVGGAFGVFDEEIGRGRDAPGDLFRRGRGREAGDDRDPPGLARRSRAVAERRAARRADVVAAADLADRRPAPRSRRRRGARGRTTAVRCPVSAVRPRRRSDAGRHGSRGSRAGGGGRGESSRAMPAWCSTSRGARGRSRASFLTPTPPAEAPAASRSTRSTRWALRLWARSATTTAGWPERRASSSPTSAFPSASGVNPMVTIEAIAYVNASALAAKIGSLRNQS